MMYSCNALDRGSRAPGVWRAWMLASHSGSIGADIAAGRVLTVPRTADHPIYCEQERRDVTHEVKWSARLG